MTALESLERRTEEILAEVAVQLQEVRRAELDGQYAPIVRTTLEEALRALQGRLGRIRGELARLDAVRALVAPLEGFSGGPRLQPPPGVVPQPETFGDRPAAPGDVGP